MPELPDQEKSQSISTGKPLSFNIGASLPTVKSISGYALQGLGWEHEKGNRYRKEEDLIEFDGVHWMLNGGKKISFIEELNEELNK